MKTELNQCLSDTGLGKVGQYCAGQSDDALKLLSFSQSYGGSRRTRMRRAGRRSMADGSQLNADLKNAKRGGTPKIRTPYTPCWGAVSDFLEFFQFSAERSKRRIKITGAGGMGVRRK